MQERELDRMKGVLVIWRMTMDPDETSRTREKRKSMRFWEWHLLPEEGLAGSPSMYFGVVFGEDGIQSYVKKRERESIKGWCSGGRREGVR